MTEPPKKTATKRSSKAPAPALAKPAVRSRDAEATKQLIAATAVQLLTEKGFTGLGVNAVAVAAGVDKQLIYYYFGGLDGLIRHLGSELSLWLGTPLTAVPDEPYAQASRRLLMTYADALRKNKLVLSLLAWELVEPSEVLTQLESTRSAAMASWVMALRQASQPPPQGIDAPAINALLIAGLHYLALRERSLGTFAGMDIRSDEGQARIAKAVELITTAVYRTPQTNESTLK
jgi:AcrR family transcriptional regulator